MTNKPRSLSDLSIAYLTADDSWVWKDDMIVFPRDDGFYEEGDAMHMIADLESEDHPICGEFPHDSIVAPRGWDKVD
jgi:hypothetical protein